MLGPNGSKQQHTSSTPAAARQQQHASSNEGYSSSLLELELPYPASPPMAPPAVLASSPPPPASLVLAVAAALVEGAAASAACAGWFDPADCAIEANKFFGRLSNRSPSATGSRSTTRFFATCSSHSPRSKSRLAFSSLTSATERVVSCRQRISRNSSQLSQWWRTFDLRFVRALPRHVAVLAARVANGLAVTVCPGAFAAHVALSAAVVARR